MWQALSLPWRACLSQAWEACLSGTIPIGAAITNSAGCIIATGRNRCFNPRQAAPSYIAGTRLAHAEVNALLDLEGRVEDPKTCALYTTTEPCPMCAGAIVMANIREVHYASRDPWAGSIDLYRSSPYMRSKHMQVAGPEELGDGGALEAALTGLAVAFFMRSEAWPDGRDPRADPHPVIARLREASPAGAALGRRLVDSGELERMRLERLPARLAFDSLEEMLKIGTIQSADSS